MQRILGQPRAIETLQSALRSERIHHAWIFSGPPGVGKFTTAVEFARILLDPTAGPNLAGLYEADPTSETSRLIDAGTHPDLHVIRKELARFSESSQVRDRKQINIPVDVLREHMIGGRIEGRYHDALAYATAARAHGKVFIIDEAELIDAVGQNALLKTLEEPPPQTYIILITSRPDRLLPTIRSRCSIVKFGLLDDASIAMWLKEARLEVPPKELAWIERFASGSPGAAQLAARYGFYHWQQTLDPLLKRSEHGDFPVEMGETMAKLVDDFAVAWVKHHENASKDAANKAGARHLLSILSSHARQGLRDAPDAERERWMDLIDLLREAESQLYFNVNMKMLLENLAVQWTRLAARQSVAT